MKSYIMQWKSCNKTRLINQPFYSNLCPLLLAIDSGGEKLPENSMSLCVIKEFIGAVTS